jgi:hypothetical protein
MCRGLRLCPPPPIFFKKVDDDMIEAEDLLQYSSHRKQNKEAKGKEMTCTRDPVFSFKYSKLTSGQPTRCYIFKVNYF